MNVIIYGVSAKQFRTLNSEIRRRTCASTCGTWCHYTAVRENVMWHEMATMLLMFGVCAFLRRDVK